MTTGVRIPEHDPDLTYLADPRLRRYSKHVFHGQDRLPIWGAIFGLAPRPKEDTFYLRQVVTLSGAELTTAHREFQRLTDLEAIEFYATDACKHEYVRLPALFWDIVDVALQVVKCEFSLDQNDRL